MNLNNNYLKYLIDHKIKVLLSLVFIVLLSPIIINSTLHHPLIIGAESYYHLNQAQNLTFGNFYYFPLFLAINFLPFNFLVVLPILLGMASIFLLIKILFSEKVSMEFNFFFLVFMILSPTFIFTFSTISSSSYFIFLSIVGFFLFIQKQPIFPFISIIPFFLATFFNGFKSIFLFFILFAYIYSNKQSLFLHKKFLVYLIMSIISLSFLVNFLLFKKPFFLGSFHIQQYIPDLISDFGGVSGVSFFVLILGLLGFMITWKKNVFYPTYILLLILSLTYFFNTETIFLFSVILIFFATNGFINMFNNKWALETIKKFTFLLFFLGFLFSFLSYMDRISDFGPFTGAENSLSWIKDNTASDTIIYSDFKESYYITYFAQRVPFNNFEDQVESQLELHHQILSAGYLSDLVPLLEENDLFVLYITPEMKEELSDDYGLLFLLKSEMFKLVYSSKGYEVWVYTKGDVPIT